jgi:RHS repeat-associated protein
LAHPKAVVVLLLRRFSFRGPGGNGKTTSYAFDDADRLISVTDAAQNATQYSYDAEDDLLSITDANGHATSFTYDAFGRVTQTTFPSSHSETYSYDAAGNLTSKIDRKGQTIQYVYDALNRLTHKGYPDSTGVDYVYDLLGKIQQANDPTGTYAFAYDNMGRLIGTTTSYSFLTSRNFTTSYTYDAASNRTGLTDPEGGVTSYAYDTLNRLSSLAPPSAFGSGSFGFSYDALSRRTQMTRPNNVTTNYSYDNLSHLLSVLHQAGGSTIDGASYAVDSVGNRTSKTDQLAAITTNYGYDAIYQLVQATQGGSTRERYSYDPVGNRLSSLGVSPYSFNSSNELVSTPSALYGFDYNGNTTSKTDSTGTTNYSWDFENRITQVTLPGTGGTESYRYDPFGRRIQKAFTQNGTTTTMNYVYDGQNVIETFDQNGSMLSRFAQGQGVDQPLAESAAGATSFYEQDGLGSVTSLTNTAGALAQTYTYDSFGNTTNSQGSPTNPFRYTGREFDSETNLYYYRARYYDPETGRFLSEDPLEFGGGINFYPYVQNSPANLSDPSGRFTLNLTQNTKPINAVWWDFTNWGFGRTDHYENLKVDCMCVGNGWQLRITLSERFDVFYSTIPYSTLPHEQEHVDIATKIFKSSASQFEAVEKVTYESKEACEAAKADVEKLLDQIHQQINEAENGPEPFFQRWWRKIF